MAVDVRRDLPVQISDQPPYLELTKPPMGRVKPVILRRARRPDRRSVSRKFRALLLCQSVGRAKTVQGVGVLQYRILGRTEPTTRRAPSWKSGSRARVGERLRSGERAHRIRVLARGGCGRANWEDYGMGDAGGAESRDEIAPGLSLTEHRDFAA